MHGLPLDLVPGVLDALQWRVGDLAACCRVSRTWREWATPRLYERLWLRDQLRVIRVFQTLSDHPHLARLVRILELRVFPFGLPAERLEQLEEQIVRTLHAAVNLHELCWTRDGSLNDRVLRTMFDELKHLRKLELTGNSKLWSPALLCDKIPRSVQELQIVLPDRHVAQHLVRLAASVDRLEALSLFCMNTSLITDALLAELAQHARLRRLTLVGCKAVHGPGVTQLAQAGAMQVLALEGVGMAPDALPALLPYTHAVRSLTLTYPKRAEDAAPFFAHLAELTSSCANLEALTLYARSGSAPALDGDDDGDAAEAPAPAPAHPVRSVPLPPGSETAVVPVAHAADKNPRLSTAFVRRLIFGRTARTLRKLWVYEMAVSMHQLQMLALSTLSDHLEDLVVHLFEADVEALAHYLSKFSRLRSVHIMSHVRSQAEFTYEDIESGSGTGYGT
ncbi:hypothetical protein MOBT1_002718 [Malassezia obtusa]|uniref:F-box domain-containing protein n=1 Tax=Malassezia obtusa TaxID=76774 RepID=A0AAF0E1F5_9BASI|nr:hypothetical protein MOBT1_002718 [Malassezia obtusa]